MELGAGGLVSHHGKSGGGGSQQDEAVGQFTSTLQFSGSSSMGGQGHKPNVQFKIMHTLPEHFLNTLDILY